MIKITSDEILGPQTLLRERERERERERRRETERDGEKNFNSGHKMQSLPIRSWRP